jgi:hypothetical protein
MQTRTLGPLKEEEEYMDNENETTTKTGHGEKYSRKKEQAMANLLTSSSVREAAKQTGVGEKTLRRWCKRPDFEKEYKEAKMNIFEATVRDLAQAGPVVVKALEKMMTQPALYEACDRLKAGEIILDTICKMAKLNNIDFQASEQDAEKVEESQSRSGAEDDAPAIKMVEEDPASAPEASGSSASKGTIVAASPEKNGGTTHAEDLNRGNTQEEPGDVNSEKVIDADDLILHRRNGARVDLRQSEGHRPEAAEPVSPLTTTGSTAPGPQMTADGPNESWWGKEEGYSREEAQLVQLKVLDAMTGGSRRRR